MVDEKRLTLADISEINRALGMIEGVTFALNDDGIAQGIMEAVERIDAVIKKGETK